MMPLPLTDIMKSMEADGFCIVPKVLDFGEVARVRTALEEAVDENKRRNIAITNAAIDPNAHNIRVNNLPDYDPVFMDLLRHPAVLPIVHALLGKSAIVSNFTANIALPGAGSMRIHSDQALVAPPPWYQPWSMNLIWCLDDLTEENGATRYLPLSHNLLDFNGLAVDAEQQMRPFIAPAGSVIAMEGRLWHTSGRNTTTDQERALLFGYYSRDFLRQQVNWEVTLTTETKARLDNEARALLGMGAISNPGFGIELVLQPGVSLPVQ